MTKVLYIDDDPSYRDIISEIFEWDFPDVECQVAETGTEGINIVKEGFAPDLVLLDLQSSGGTIEGALQTLALLKELAPKAQVVAYTAHPDYTTSTLLGMGFDAHCDIKGDKASPAAFRQWIQKYL